MVADLFITVQSQGQGPNQKYWGIKQNEARLTYLNHYYGSTT